MTGWREREARLNVFIRKRMTGAERRTGRLSRSDWPLWSEGHSWISQCVHLRRDPPACPPNQMFHTSQDAYSTDWFNGVIYVDHEIMWFTRLVSRNFQYISFCWIIKMNKYILASKKTFSCVFHDFLLIPFSLSLCIYSISLYPFAFFELLFFVVLDLVCLHPPLPLLYSNTSVFPSQYVCHFSALICRCLLVLL